MLNELQNLVSTEKERKLQVYINQLIIDLFANEKIEVNSKELLELLSYLTSSDNISTQMRSAVAIQNSRIVDILHKKEVEHLKKYIEYLEENSISKQKVNDILAELNNQYIEIDGSIDIHSKSDDRGKVDCLQMIGWLEGKLEELLQESEDK